jgi:hypothetical protein
MRERSVQYISEVNSRTYTFESRPALGSTVTALTRSFPGEKNPPVLPTRSFR